MNKNFSVVLIVFFLGISVGFSQNTRSASPIKAPKPVYQSPKKTKKSFLKGKKKGQNEVLIDEYHKRLKSVRKERNKKERLSDKKKYSDPRYMGHRRPPKKRKPGKKKFCKVCGIRH